MFLFVVIPAVILLSFLLFISPLMIWLNLRRMRRTLHDDLTALRNSIDRLAGGANSAPRSSEEPAAQPSQPPAIPAVAAEPPKADAIGFSCPECGKFFEGPASLSGTTYTCPECHIDFHIH